MSETYTRAELEQALERAAIGMLKPLNVLVGQDVLKRFEGKLYDGDWHEGFSSYVGDLLKEHTRQAAKASANERGTDGKAKSRDADDDDDDEGGDVEGLTPADVEGMSVDRFIKVQGKLMKALGKNEPQPVRESKPKAAPEKPEGKKVFTPKEIEAMSPAQFARNHDRLMAQVDEISPPDRGYRNPQPADLTEYREHIAALAASDSDE